jgi:hypothetical protein
VVKAFNNIYARHLMELRQPKGTPGRIALPGSLDESWRQQPSTPVYTKDFDAVIVRRALSEASRERKPEWRATSKSPGSFENPA